MGSCKDDDTDIADNSTRKLPTSETPTGQEGEDVQQYKSSMLLLRRLSIREESIQPFPVIDWPAELCLHSDHGASSHGRSRNHDGNKIDNDILSEEAQSTTSIMATTNITRRRKGSTNKDLNNKRQKSRGMVRCMRTGDLSNLSQESG